MLMAKPVGSRRLVATGVIGSGIDFAHILCKRFGCLQRRKVFNNLGVEPRAGRCDLVALEPGEGDFVCDQVAASLKGRPRPLIWIKPPRAAPAA